MALAVAADFEIFYKGDSEKCSDDVRKALHVYTAQVRVSSRVGSMLGLWVGVRVKVIGWSCDCGSG